MKYTIDTLINTDFHDVSDEIIMRELARKMVNDLPLKELRKIFNFETTQNYGTYQQVRYTMTITLPNK